jgi:cell division septum initiation protein DivIVA
MSNLKLQAANDIRRLATTFRGILSLAEELQEIGSIEQARDEAQKTLDSLNGQIADKDCAFQQLLQKATSNLDAKRKEADEVIEQAHKQAELVIAKASLEAKKIVADANSRATQIREESEALHGEHLKNMAMVRAEIQEAKVNHADIKRDTEDSRSEHGRLIKLIEDLKAKF